MTADQIEGLKGVVAELFEYPSKQLFLGYFFAAALGLQTGITDPFYTLGTGFYQYMVVNDTNWDYATDFNQSVIDMGIAINPGKAIVTDYRMDAFRKRGGRFMHYVGTNDPSIPC